jgi:hypothetical protein
VATYMAQPQFATSSWRVRDWKLWTLQVASAQGVPPLVSRYLPPKFTYFFDQRKEKRLSRLQGNDVGGVVSLKGGSSLFL